ncbi:hypothetical protein [Clostridium nigeriense]|uniref:hypothetical protein n=1 Tax=Clostridium nigeriense TaxID=1805470 RepID=UPI00082FF75D|nr:hypothetical protein [Clostridium nigeriense]
MSSLKKVFYKFIEEKYNDESDNSEEIICSICGKYITVREAYIKDEDFKIFCSKECYLKQLNSKYY